jgi:hypothetical protein
MDLFFVTAFWATMIMLGIALLVLYFILTNKSSLRRKGYQEEYIKYLRKSHLIRICSIAVVLPLIILFSAWIVSKITGELTEEVQMAYIVIIMFVLVIPFKYIDETLNQKRIRKLAIDTHEKVVIDLHYRTLHLIFHPWFELILAASALAYGVLWLKIEQWVVYFFLVIPWFMYFTIRGTRYQVRPYLKDNYQYLFTFNLFNFLLFFLYFFSNLVIRMRETLDAYATDIMESTYGIQPVLWLIIGIIISIGWLGRIAIYLANYRQFSAEINGRETPAENPGSRRLWFFSASLILLMLLFGLGMKTDVLRQGRTQVGRVLEKYIIDQDSGSADTLAIIDHRGVFYTAQAAGYASGLEQSDVPRIEAFLQENKDRNLRLYCRIEECRSKDVRSFEICCAKTFDSMPLEALIKFEYSFPNTITGLIDE